MTEIGDQIAMRVDDWRWSMLSRLDLWNVRLFVGTLSMGFALGYMCAVKFEKARMKQKPIPVVTKIVEKIPVPSAHNQKGLREERLEHSHNARTKGSF